MKKNKKGTTFPIWIILILISLAIAIEENLPQIIDIAGSSLAMISAVGIFESYFNLTERIEKLEEESK